jgi:hypothetical protein
MEISGVVQALLPEVTGQGKNGTWRKLEFVVEIEAGQYPKKVCFTLWGDKIDQAQLRTGEKVTVSFDLESREYNSRWFTEAKAWKVTKGGAVAGATDAPTISNDELPPLPEMDDLPF